MLISFDITELLSVQYPEYLILYLFYIPLYTKFFQKHREIPTSANRVSINGVAQKSTPHLRRKLSEMIRRYISYL